MKLLKYLKEYRFQAVAAPLFKLLECFVDLAVPLITARIIDYGVQGGDRTYIFRGCTLMILLGLGGLAVSVTSQYFSAAAAVGFSSKLRQATFQHIQSLDHTARRSLGADTLIARLTGDIDQVQTGLNLFLRLFMRSPFIIIGSVMVAFSINKRIALIFAATVPVLGLLVFITMRISSPIFKNARTKLDTVVGITRSMLSGMRVIRAFGREDAEAARFTEASNTLAKIQTRAGVLSALSTPLSSIVVSAAIIAVLYLGAFEFSAGVITAGAIVALVGYMTQIMIELVKFANLTVQVTRATASAGRISSLLDIKSSIEYLPDELYEKKAFLSANEAVRFQDVSLKYPGAGSESLTKISFTAKCGETIGIIGGTGSGKTSLINLIPRFYDVTAGTVFVNGIPVNRLSRNTLRSIVGIAPQKALLFSGTVRSNLMWGLSGTVSAAKFQNCGSLENTGRLKSSIESFNKSASESNDISDSLLWQALERAQAADFVRANPLGLDSKVEQGGRNYSGGQRQRLTVARALVRAAASCKAGLPFILILDDSSSALDFSTEAALRKALGELAGEVTTFIVSQRSSLVRSADLILVLEDGRLAGSGSHDELIENCPVYREICESQYGERGGFSA